VQPRRRTRELDQQRGAELRYQRKVDLLTRGRDETVEGLVVQRNHVHAVAVIEIALNDESQRIVAVVGDNRQHDDARLGAGIVVETQPHPWNGRRILGERRTRCSNRASEQRQCTDTPGQSHFRNSGSKLNTTGSTSSENPVGSGPNAPALDAASTAPCASRSKEKLPERLTNVRSETEPSR